MLLPSNLNFNIFLQNNSYLEVSALGGSNGAGSMDSAASVLLHQGGSELSALLLGHANGDGTVDLSHTDGAVEVGNARVLVAVLASPVINLMKNPVNV